MNTRTDSDGNKVLFLEEVQSDWGQKGKKEGFKSELITDLPKGFTVRNIGNGYYFQDANGRDIVDVYDATSFIDAKEKAIQKINSFDRKHPSAPFVTDTNAWTKLGLKTALKEAVAQGAERIAGTTGEQQNERYDLSKQVDEIGWQKNENGTSI